MKVAVDFGISNTDIVTCDESQKKFFSIPTKDFNNNILEKIFNVIKIDVNKIEKIAVTGGKSSSLPDKFKNIDVNKVNEIDAIGLGTIEIYGLLDEPFVSVSTGTGTACVHFDSEKFNHLGGISVGGGTLQGLSKLINNESNPDVIENMALMGDKNHLDILIGDVVNEIGSLYPDVTASNFAKARNDIDPSPEDISASISNMVGEVIGTISYLNAMICGLDKVYFVGRVTLNSTIKKGIEDRLSLANVKGIFEENREYGNVLGALKFLETK
ncbi:MAG: pantothenate kinase [Gammaproteobacteria bacterium]|nr:pantothenate kinase [Gammaproteobacteria bacterium]|tara:strand:+ start:7586 stop:8398 length:813 start_codon:yes stop_codon:yes gene_type:complete